jgi:hypothetical protein
MSDSLNFEGFPFELMDWPQCHLDTSIESNPLDPELFDSSSSLSSISPFNQDSLSPTSWSNEFSPPLFVSSPNPTPSNPLEPQPCITVLKAAPESVPSTAIPEKPIIHRNRPGRPSKAQLASNTRPTGRAAITIRRTVHNDSASRSRARFTKVLDELWNVVPERERIVAQDVEPTRPLSRAEKIEIVIGYVRELQGR